MLGVDPLSGEGMARWAREVLTIYAAWGVAVLLGGRLTMIRSPGKGGWEMMTRFRAHLGNAGAAPGGHQPGAPTAIRRNQYRAKPRIAVGAPGW